MKKGLLLCSGGMSTTMIAKALNDLAKAEKIDFEWDAMGVNSSSEWEDIMGEYAFVFMSPQIVYKHADIKKSCDAKKIPSAPILPQNYISLKTPVLWEEVKKALKL